ncbi:MAG TPA: ATP-binding protein [Streptosporangiaceae bacterium]|nr:ATP-binding protein [Streptosporangiaceae bacterium]
MRLTREPSAAAEARSQVRAAIRDWKVPVDPDIAIVLTSDLVTNAILHGEGETITLAVRCARGHLRIDVYDSSRYAPAAVDTPGHIPGDAQAASGLVLVAALSADWGSFRTPAGKAMYFTLALQPDPLRGCDRAPAGDQTWGRRAVGTPPGSSAPLQSTLRKTPTGKGKRGHYAQESTRTAGFWSGLDQELSELRRRQLRRGGLPARRRGRRPQQPAP